MSSTPEEKSRELLKSYFCAVPKKTWDETIRLLKECALKYGQTLIAVTHDPDIVRKADCNITIEDGQFLTIHSRLITSLMRRQPTRKISQSAPASP